MAKLYKSERVACREILLLFPDKFFPLGMLKHSFIIFRFQEDRMEVAEQLIDFSEQLASKMRQKTNKEFESAQRNLSINFMQLHSHDTVPFPSETK